VTRNPPTESRWPQAKPPPLSRAKRQEPAQVPAHRAAHRRRVGAGLSGFLPLIYSRKKRLRPPGALDEKDFLASCIKCGQCVQVCPVQAIKLADLVDGIGVGAPYIDAASRPATFPATPCSASSPARPALTYHKPDFLTARPARALAAKPILLAKEKDPEPTLNLTERMGVARLTRPEGLPGDQGQGLQGSGARPHDFKGMLRYMDVDRWKPIKIADHPYDVEECDLCVRECPVKGAISIETVLRPGRQQTQVAGGP
jgi:ferredoxin-type protein NapG